MRPKKDRTNQITINEVVEKFGFPRSLMLRYIRNGMVKTISRSKNTHYYDRRKVLLIIKSETEIRKYDCVRYEKCLSVWANDPKTLKNPCVLCDEYRKGEI